MVETTALIFDVDGTLAETESTRIKAVFGDVTGAGVDAYVRNVVVSAPGRFIRAGFVAIAASANPTLRFFFSREAYTSPSSTTARFTVRYGQGTDPYDGNEYDEETFSAPLGTANHLYEIPVALSGLTARSPFWFQIHRAWDDAADGFEGTVHLHYATVRSA